MYFKSSTPTNIAGTLRKTLPLYAIQVNTDSNYVITNPILNCVACGWRMAETLELRPCDGTYHGAYWWLYCIDTHSIQYKRTGILEYCTEISSSELQQSIIRRTSVATTSMEHDKAQATSHTHPWQLKGLQFRVRTLSPRKWNEMIIWRVVALSCQHPI